MKESCAARAAGAKARLEKVKRPERSDRTRLTLRAGLCSAPSGSTQSLRLERRVSGCSGERFRGPRSAHAPLRPRASFPARPRLVLFPSLAHAPDCVYTSMPTLELEAWPPVGATYSHWTDLLLATQLSALRCGYAHLVCAGAPGQLESLKIDIGCRPLSLSRPAPGLCLIAQQRGARASDSTWTVLETAREQDDAQLKSTASVRASSLKESRPVADLCLCRNQSARRSEPATSSSTCASSTASKERSELQLAGGAVSSLTSSPGTSRATATPGTRSRSPASCRRASAASTSTSARSRSSSSMARAGGASRSRARTRAWRRARRRRRRSSSRASTAMCVASSHARQAPLEFVLTRFASPAGPHRAA